MALSKAFFKLMLRAASAVPFLVVANWCFSTMDPPKIVESAQPVVDSGFIEWAGGRVQILEKFYGAEGLDQTLRAGLPTFAPSTFGYDSISSWQNFQFMVDLTPIYTIWFLESSRAVNSWTPAYFPAFFVMLGQLAGVGTIVPFFYFLCFTFGPSASDLARASRRQLCPSNNIFVVPLVVLFHTSLIFAMFTAPEMAARHYWTFAWQLSPLYMGTANIITRQLAGALSLRKSSFLTPNQMLIVTSLISSGVWIYTVFYAPHSLSTLFVPDSESQTGLVLHMRKALQADQIGEVAGIFLWLAYSFLDIFASGLSGASCILYITLAPIALLCVGPGATFALGWYVREGILEFAAKP